MASAPVAFSFDRPCSSRYAGAVQRGYKYPPIAGRLPYSGAEIRQMAQQANIPEWASGTYDYLCCELERLNGLPRVCAEQYDIQQRLAQIPLLSNLGQCELYPGNLLELQAMRLGVPSQTIQALHQQYGSARSQLFRENICNAIRRLTAGEVKSLTAPLPLVPTVKLEPLPPSATTEELMTRFLQQYPQFTAFLSRQPALALAPVPVPVPTTRPVPVPVPAGIDLLTGSPFFF